MVVLHMQLCMSPMYPWPCLQLPLQQVCLEFYQGVACSPSCTTGCTGARLGRWVRDQVEVLCDRRFDLATYTPSWPCLNQQLGFAICAHIACLDSRCNCGDNLVHMIWCSGTGQAQKMAGG